MESISLRTYSLSLPHLLVLNVRVVPVGSLPAVQWSNSQAPTRAAVSTGYTDHKLTLPSFPPTANHAVLLPTSSSESESSSSGADDGRGPNARACRLVRWYESTARGAPVFVEYSLALQLGQYMRKYPGITKWTHFPSQPATATSLPSARMEMEERPGEVVSNLSILGRSCDHH